MPSMELSKITPDLKKQPSFIRITADKNDSECNRLEEMIAGWEKEYYFMDHPIKPQQRQRPSSETPTIDKILLSLFLNN